MRHIFWAGDSTAASNKYVTYPQTGIAQAFDRYTRTDVVVVNHAFNGRSTKSFIDESRLAPIYNDITKGDYLFIQFGHNDEYLSSSYRCTYPLLDPETLDEEGKNSIEDCTVDCCKQPVQRPGNAHDQEHDMNNLHCLCVQLKLTFKHKLIQKAVSVQRRNR